MLLDSWEEVQSKNYDIHGDKSWPRDYDFKKKKPFKDPDSKSQWIAFVDSCKETKRKKPKGTRAAPTMLSSCPKQEAEGTQEALERLIEQPGPASLERLLWAAEAPLRDVEFGSATVAKSIMTKIKVNKVLFGKKPIFSAKNSKK
jgi:hypothetical protein